MPLAANAPFAHTLQTFKMPSGAAFRFHSLPALAAELVSANSPAGS